MTFARAAAVVVAVGFVVASPQHATAADVFLGPTNVGRVVPATRDRWDIYRLGRRIAYVKKVSLQRWDVIQARTLVGYVQRVGDRWELWADGVRGAYVVRTSTARWKVFSLYNGGPAVFVGTVNRAPGGPAAGAAFVLIFG
jgi:hypothetical protein